MGARDDGDDFGFANECKKRIDTLLQEGKIKAAAGDKDPYPTLLTVLRNLSDVLILREMPDYIDELLKRKGDDRLDAQARVLVQGFRDEFIMTSDDTAEPIRKTGNDPLAELLARRARKPGDSTPP